MIQSNTINNGRVDPVNQMTANMLVLAVESRHDLSLISCTEEAIRIIGQKFKYSGCFFLYVEKCLEKVNLSEKEKDEVRFYFKL